MADDTVTSVYRVGGVPKEYNPVAVLGGILPQVPVVVAGSVMPLQEALQPNVDTATRPYRTVAAATAAAIPAPVIAIDTVGVAQVGVGAARYLRSAVTGPGPGRFQSRDGAWWELSPGSILTLEQLGAGTGNATIDLASIQQARRLRTLARLDRPLIGLDTNDLDSYMNVALYGAGSVDLYRKYVSGDLVLPSTMHLAGDLSPGEHCPTSCRSRTNIEVLIGDSISTYQANTNNRSGMLATLLERELRTQAQASGRMVQFYDRAIGGQTLNNVADKPITPPDRVIAWYPDRARRWLDVVKDLNPTRVFISMGMNDLGSISYNALNSVVNEIKSWPSLPDVVLLTNLVPRPYVGPLLPANGPWNDRATQEGADRAAGLVRTYAKRYGIGLLDMHRMCCRARDGFDPCEGTIRMYRDSIAAQKGAFGTRQIYNYAVRFRPDLSKFATDGSAAIALNHGPGTGDLIYITRIGDTSFSVSVFTGDSGELIPVGDPRTVTIATPSDQPLELAFEKTGNFGILYMAGLTAAGGYGESNPNIWSELLVSRGGMFVPSIAGPVANSFMFVGFDYGTPTIVRPSVDPATLFDTGDGSPDSGRNGGSGYNHPSSYVEPHVYMPVLRGTRFYAEDAFRQPVPVLRDMTFGAIAADGGYRYHRTNLFPSVFGKDGRLTFTVGTSAANGYFVMDYDGSFSAPNGPLRSPFGIKLDASRPFPAVFAEGNRITIATGAATATAYFFAYNDGSFEVPGSVRSRGAVVARCGRRAIADANASLAATDVYIAVTSLTAARVLGLPPASSFEPGQPLYVADESGACSFDAGRTITLVAAASDTVAGQPSVAIGEPYRKLTLHSNGSNLWTYA